MFLQKAALAIFILSIPNVLGAAINPEEGPYFQGDIIPTFSHKSGRIDPKYRWHNRTISYEFAPDYPKVMQNTFQLATQHISQRTCLQFKPLDQDQGHSQQDHLFVVHSVSSACFSYVGRQGGRQLISLPLGCHSLGTFVHELLHSVGFHHEHARTDRDDFVSIQWENIAAGKEGQFTKYGAATVSSFGVPYDYNSILHYGRNAFSKDPARLNTIIPRQGNASIGQRRGMSIRDAEKVNRMYGCKI